MTKLNNKWTACCTVYCVYETWIKHYRLL